MANTIMVPFPDTEGGTRTQLFHDDGTVAVDPNRPELARLRNALELGVLAAEHTKILRAPHACASRDYTGDPRCVRCLLEGRYA